MKKLYPGSVSTTTTNGYVCSSYYLFICLYNYSYWNYTRNPSTCVISYRRNQLWVRMKYYIFNLINDNVYFSFRKEIHEFVFWGENWFVNSFRTAQLVGSQKIKAFNIELILNTKLLALASTGIPICRQKWLNVSFIGEVRITVSYGIPSMIVSKWFSMSV